MGKGIWQGGTQEWIGGGGPGRSPFVRLSKVCSGMRSKSQQFILTPVRDFMPPLIRCCGTSFSIETMIP